MSTAEIDNTPTLDSIISAVADEHRRAILRVLNRTAREAVHLDTLVDAVAGRIDRGDLTGDEHRHLIRVRLHQLHLPKLRSCGMVRYDTETKQVRNTPGELTRELLAVIESYETTD